MGAIVVYKSSPNLPQSIAPPFHGSNVYTEVTDFMFNYFSPVNVLRQRETDPEMCISEC